MYACLARGLSFKVGAGRCLTLCPPLVISDTDFDVAFAILEDVLRDACADAATTGAT